MLRRLGLEDFISYTRISSYEIGNNEPPLTVLLGYARLAGVHIEALIDDELELPGALPGAAKHDEIRREYIPRRKVKAINDKPTTRKKESIHMISNVRLRAARLPEKLLAIRSALGFSQMEMLRRLGAERLIQFNGISAYEMGKREPPLTILLQYSRVAGIHLEDLVDDAVVLPEKLPGRVRARKLKTL
jgi:transcriptional regulator with XRE-family HTH domain